GHLLGTLLLPVAVRPSVRGNFSGGFCPRGRRRRLSPGSGLWLGGLTREGGSFFAGLSPGGSFFAEPLPLRLGACDGRFFLEGGPGWACFGFSPPGPKR